MVGLGFFEDDIKFQSSLIVKFIVVFDSIH